MDTLYCLTGKSSTGKDTLARALLALPGLGLRRLVTYTTRPIRPGERDGADYHFVTPETLDRLAAELGEVERRVYQTIHGPWHYATLRDASLDEPGAALTVTPPEMLLSYRRAFGGAVKPLYIETPDRLRLERAIEREARAAAPRYSEVCRRYLADESDFSEAALAACGVERRFDNTSLEDCLAALTAYIANVGVGVPDDPNR